MSNDQRGPFGHILGPRNAKMRRVVHTRHLHDNVSRLLSDVLRSANYRHWLATTEPDDRDGMARMLNEVLLHAHDRARADLPDAPKGCLRVTIAIPTWVVTALPWHQREEAIRSPNFQWVPMWEDPCADTWHLVALASVDDDAAPATTAALVGTVAPSILLDNYQWIGVYPVPTFHAGMAPHEPCGGGHTTDQRGPNR